jgi:6-phospho-beta-glucosidase
MRIALLGGSSLSTPALFASLATRHDLPGLGFVLVGRDATALDANRRAAALLLGDAPVALETARLADPGWPASLAGADCVLVQARIGGFAGRAWDETVPHAYGIVGDEGLGPSGLSAALRAWPALEPLLERVEAAAPHAWVVLLSSPVGLLTRVARLRFPAMRLAGICELPWTTLRGVCDLLRVPVGEVGFDYLGVNHLGWLHGIVHGARDLVAEYASARQHTPDFPRSDLVQRAAAIPARYLRLHFEAARVLEEQRRSARSRGVQLEQLKAQAVPVYARGSRSEIEAALGLRPAPWYEHAVVPFVLGLAGRDPGIPVFLSVPNQGWCARLPDDDVLEIPHRFDGGRPRPQQAVRAASPFVLDLTRRFLASERLAAGAVVGRDPARIEEALVADPWVPDRATAAALAVGLLAQMVSWEGARGPSV